ncbi:MAG TPA: choice-of-anchor Q domain-containing protein, partial [Gemmatimonadales bacterium]|nr:choice-of-anchor Q domain-containing protein [Gemmatimonadales bacterium]
GGGIANYGTATVSNSLVSGNTASSASDDAAGGGIHNCGTLTVANSHITKNTAKTTSSSDSSYGGGVNNGGGPGGCSGTASLSQSTISLNKAEFGAGVYNDIGTVNMENSTVSGNKATFWGGGIFNDGTMTVSNVTITKNTAKFGGGLYNSSGTTTLRRTLISGNKAPSGAGPEVYNNTGNVVVDTFNLFGQKNNAGVAHVSPGATDVIPASNVTTPKILSPALKDNGGPTPTHALVLGSPALDQIASGAPATDQRGVTRPQNGLSDIGAFELE